MHKKKEPGEKQQCKKKLIQKKQRFYLLKTHTHIYHI